MKDGNAPALTLWGLGRRPEFSSLLLRRSRNCTALSESQGRPGDSYCPPEPRQGVSLSQLSFIDGLFFAKIKGTVMGKAWGITRGKRKGG